MDSEKKDVEYGLGCCFCNEGIKSISFDPCSITIRGHCDRDVPDHPTQDFFCHFECLRKHLHEELYKNCPNTFGKIQFHCCFCNQLIESTDINPCSLTITTEWDKQVNQLGFGNLFCHIDCLKASFHSYYKNYLYVELFSIEED